MEDSIDTIVHLSSMVAGFATAYVAVTAFSYRDEKSQLVVLQALHQNRQKTLEESKDRRSFFPVDSFMNWYYRVLDMGGSLGRCLARRRFKSGKYDNAVNDLKTLIDEEAHSLAESGEESSILEYGGTLSHLRIEVYRAE